MFKWNAKISTCPKGDFASKCRREDQRRGQLLRMKAGYGRGSHAHRPQPRARRRRSPVACTRPLFQFSPSPRCSPSIPTSHLGWPDQFFLIAFPSLSANFPVAGSIRASSPCFRPRSIVFLDSTNVLTQYLRLQCRFGSIGNLFKPCLPSFSAYELQLVKTITDDQWDEIRWSIATVPTKTPAILTSVRHADVNGRDGFYRNRGH